MLLSFLLACGVTEPGFNPTGVRTDKDDGGGSIADGGGDSGGGTDTSSGDTDTSGELLCGANDLELTMVVSDTSEATGTAFTWPTEITTRAVFTNPCDGTLGFTTATSCIVDTWTLVDGVGTDTTFSGNCVDSATTWTLDAKEATSVTASWGILDRSTYQVTAASTAVGRSSTEFFSVQ